MGNKKTEKPLNFDTEFLEKVKLLLKNGELPLNKEHNKRVSKIIENLEKFQTELEIRNSELNRAHLDIEKAKNQYSQLFNFAPIGLLISDENGVIHNANRTFQVLLDTELSYIINKPIILFVASEYHSAFYLHLNKVLEKGETAQCELKILKKNGGSLFIHVESVLLNYYNMKSEDDSEQKYFLSAIFDISQQKKFETILKRSESNYRRLFENLQDTFIRSDQSGNIVMASPSIEELLGYKQDVIIGTNEKKLYADPPAWYHFKDKLYETGSIEGFETKMKGKEGEEIWVSINAQLFTDERGKILGIEEIIRNITPHKRKDEENRALAALIQNIPDPVLLFNHGGIITYFNHTAAGYFYDENKEIAIHEIIHKSDQSKLKKEIPNALKKDGIWRGELTFVSKSGQTGKSECVFQAYSDGASENSNCSLFIKCFKDQ